MKLTIKTLLHSTFKVDIGPDETVKDLKAKIEAEQGKEYPSSSQKLIYSGRILADESKIAEYNFDEKKFIVLMITRPPPVAKQATQASAPNQPKETSSTAKVSDDASDSKPNITRSKPTTAASTATNTASVTTTPVASNPTGSSVLQQQPFTAERPSSDRQSALNEASALSLGDPNLAPRLAAMMSQPHFRQMQDLIQQSPHLLSSTIEALAASDPEMYSFISQNPDAFVNALNHPPAAGNRTPLSGAALSGQHASSEHQSGGGLAQPVVDQILGDGVSDHDKEAIERLKELGFSEYLAVQAYMACDKDEQLAANLLFQMDQ